MPTIVYVEDDDIIRQNYTDLLEGSGYAVHAHRDAASALEERARRGVDLYLLDVGLADPERSGLWLCRRLRDAEADVPIIILSSHDAPADRQAGLACGASEYLTKDVSFSELLERIRANLRAS